MQTWYADLRFAHQIVVSRSQEQVASKPKSVGQEVSVYLVDTQSKLQGISSCETNMKGESHV
jgi:hypothetical protein